MIKVDIVNEVRSKSYSASFDTQELANSWIAKQVHKNSWGFNERDYIKDSVPSELTDRIISERVESVVDHTDGEEEVYTFVNMVTVKCDYVITTTDLSLDVDFRNQCQIECRKKEYKSIEEVIHIILDHGIDSQEFIDLQSERAVIKGKYPKE